jgi:hypothetical protein
MGFCLAALLTLGGYHEESTSQRENYNMNNEKLTMGDKMIIN